MYAILAVGLVILIAVIALSEYNKRVVPGISLIVYGEDEARWENLKHGVELACEESGAEFTMVNMSSNGTASDQIELINREIDRGATGLLIAAVDSEQIGVYASELNISIPIVFVENGPQDYSKEACISADNYEMGRMLGEKIKEKENPIVKVAIISDNTQRASVQSRIQGVYDTLDGYVNQIVIWERLENENNLLTRKFLQRAILQEAVDVVVALDNETADNLMDALDNLNRKTKVYAISTSNKSVYYLDQMKIKALEYQDEFSIGYIGARKVLTKSKTNDLGDIEYRIVSKDNMYEKDNQTFLFPIVQ